MSEKIGALLGRHIRLQSANYPERFIAREGAKILLKVDDGSPAFQRASTWAVVPSMCGTGLAFKDRDEGVFLSCLPGQNLSTLLKGFENDSAAWQRTGWIPHRGLARPGVSFEAVCAGGHFLRHSYFQLVHGRYDSTDLFNADATFIVTEVAPLQVTGQWEKLFSDPNPATDWNRVADIRVGVSVPLAGSQMSVPEWSWLLGLDRGAKAMGRSIREVLSHAGYGESLARTKRNSWIKEHKPDKPWTFHGKKAVPYSLWRWVYTLKTIEAVTVNVATDILGLVNTADTPPRLKPGESS